MSFKSNSQMLSSTFVHDKKYADVKVMSFEKDE